jgi:hypothetical protein
VDAALSLLWGASLVEKVLGGVAIVAAIGAVAWVLVRLGK